MWVRDSGSWWSEVGSLKSSDETKMRGFVQSVRESGLHRCKGIEWVCEEESVALRGGTIGI